MKIAVISDIHGNMQALETVLQDIKANEIDKIFCLGDLAMAGPQPDLAVDKIMELAKDDNFEIIQGNTDFMIVNSADFVDKVKSNLPIMGNALEADAKLLNSKQKEFLASLPAQKELQVEGLKVLLVHGSPRRNDENIFPNMKLEEVEEMIKDTDANLILCGHTHIPCGYQTHTKQTVVNAGSVGRPFSPEPKASYIIINLTSGSYSLEHQLLNYDKEKAADILSKRGFEGAEKLSTILINPETRHM